jgi:hypothetical protein
MQSWGLRGTAFVFALRCERHESLKQWDEYTGYYRGAEVTLRSRVASRPTSKWELCIQTVRDRLRLHGFRRQERTRLVPLRSVQGLYVERGPAFLHPEPKQASKELEIPAHVTATLRATRIVQSVGGHIDCIPTGDNMVETRWWDEFWAVTCNLLSLDQQQTSYNIHSFQTTIYDQIYSSTDNDI